MHVMYRNDFFFRAPTDFWCSPPDNIPRESLSLADWKNISSPPWHVNASIKTPARNSCYIYDLNWSEIFKENNGSLASAPTHTAKLTKCTKFQHNHTFWKHTIIQVWNGDCCRI